MLIISITQLLIVIFVVQGFSVSYNQPKLCSTAKWNTNGFTFADNFSMNSAPYDIFINTNNTIYFATKQNKSQILIWYNATSNISLPISNITNKNIYGLFSTDNRHLYVSVNGESIHKYSWTSGINYTVTRVNSMSGCYNIFVDINGSIYCSMTGRHQVVKYKLNATEIVAGTGCHGFVNNMLYSPQGIFVHTNFSLYVADCGNNRIQFFPYNQSDVITLIGNSVHNSLTLNCPSGIILDADENLYIVDKYQNRIIRSSSNGIEILIDRGLSQPQSIAFDNTGNIYVTNGGSNTIQKFMFIKETCDNSTTLPNMVTSVTHFQQESSTYLPALNSSTNDSYNYPKLSMSASWSADAITIGQIGDLGNTFSNLFINTNDVMYVASFSYGRVQVWNLNEANSSKILIDNLLRPSSIFVTENGDMFVATGSPYYDVMKWSSSSPNGIPVMYVTRRCTRLFVDRNNTLYCSIAELHQVVARSLNNESDATRIVAGTGCAESGSINLNNPHGILVDAKFSLYVADCSNKRVQRFSYGEMNATTVVGNGASNTASLSCPTDIVFDADDNLFIVDSGQNRIFGPGSEGFRCVVGCFGSGSTPSQLSNPQSMSFDSHGNIFVVDTNNKRLQKFILVHNSCEIIETSTVASTTTINANVFNASQYLTVSYNRPTLDPLATWSVNGITWASNDLTGLHPYSIFITTENTIYAANRQSGEIQIWYEGNMTNSQVIKGNISNPRSLFVTDEGHIYIDSGYPNGHVEKWSANDSIYSTIMNVEQECYGLFVDLRNILYCSIMDRHQVVAKSLENDSDDQVTVAGTGCSGSSLSMLSYPCGIFVDHNTSLYVADCGNNRVQLFYQGESIATTIILNGITGIFSLNCPTGVTLDANNYLFIVDNGNHRILGSGPNGFRCLLGCISQPASTSNQLSYPQTMSFDKYGNIFVVDTGNSRIQKFILLNNTLVPSYNQPKFCSSVNWDLNGIVLDIETNTLALSDISIDKTDAIYTLYTKNNQSFIWKNGFQIPLNISVLNSSTIFSTSLNNIYIGGGNSQNFQIQQQIDNTTYNISILYGFSSCSDIFIDITNTMYCSISQNNQVVKKWLNDGLNTSAIIAGTGTSGSLSQLRSPRGIFVDINFDLYIADSGYNRIQLYHLSQLSTSTVAGNGTPDTIDLKFPTGVVLDADNYLFIVDSGNKRIVGSSLTGFRCIIGCIESDLILNKLVSPQSMSFDSAGNIYVVDSSNNQVQQFNLTTNSCDISYNQPKFSLCATWSPNATTIASKDIVGTQPRGLFVNAINTLYMMNQNTSQILVWPQGSQTVTRNITGNFSRPICLFISVNGEIYTQKENFQIDKWLRNAADSNTTVAYVANRCYGIFLDTNNSLYCSIGYRNEVVKFALNDSTNASKTVAGNGTNGSDSYSLYFPRGIFVDVDFDLYVADCRNDHIQLFHLDQRNGTTVAGNGSMSVGFIYSPVAVILDADKQLFVVNAGNHQIILVRLNDTQCLVGCNGAGSLSDQLQNPRSISFDSYGNILVADRDNNRIQRFNLATNSCLTTTTSTTSSTTTSSTTTTSTSTTTITTTTSTSTSTTSSTTTSTTSTTTSTTTTTATTTSSTTTSSTTATSTTTTTPTTSTNTMGSSIVANAFIPLPCQNPNKIGIDCNTSSTPCETLQPCKNHATCQNTNDSLLGYTCTCPDGFDGDQCQNDQRPCKSNTCWNNGTCSETSKTTFKCLCNEGWIGDHCETMINYCENVICLNNGVCRPSFMNYTCECLDESYSGRHCENVATSRVILKTVTKSLGYIAMIVLGVVVGFFVIMDVLKYGFGIDPVKEEREKIRRAKAIERMKKRRRVLVQKFTYVNEPSTEGKSANIRE